VTAKAKTTPKAGARAPRSGPARLSVAYVPLDRLKPDPGNARRHSAKQVGQIARSIEAFGFNVPILVDGDGNVVAGHGRLAAARRLGFGEIPAIRLEHLSEAEKHAFMIADNRLAEVAVWDDRLLGEALKALTVVDLDFDIEAIGFEMGEIDLRIESLNAAERCDDEPPDPAVAGRSVSRAGDRWRLGPHELLCGEARDGERASDPRYCDVILRRWQALTGATARHQVSGASFDEIAQRRAAEAQTPSPASRERAR
jgi:hypothetical protein